MPNHEDGGLSQHFALSWERFIPFLQWRHLVGVLLLIAYSLIDMHHIKKIVKMSKPETAVLAVTFVATLLVELEFAIYIGVILSSLLYLNRTSPSAHHQLSA
ncbi:MAG TPA: hypothetical protein VL087_00280 [Nitrospirota bacterium]|nr:hypothetical protein [Nitrospirota bacterium]